MRLESYAEGKWHAGNGAARDIFDAVTGEKIAEASSEGLDFQGMRAYARNVGGPNLRRMTFHNRARMIKSLALYLHERRKELYPLSHQTGATKRDTWIDVDGGIGTLFVFASKGRRELPDETFHVEGDAELLSKGGNFVGRHICVPLEGVAVHINAFNFPCWGMLEKLAPTWLAGMPAIVKPATASAYLTEAMVKMMLESKILPEGILQLICGGTGDLLEHVDHQDVVTLTGSAVTGNKLRSMPNIVNNSVRFNMEADSLNCCILGPDVEPKDPEFGLFIEEVAREMTVKAGQKCTAIRRTIVPESRVDAVVDALKARLALVKVGDPTLKDIDMGPLVGKSQAKDVLGAVNRIAEGCELIYGEPGNVSIVGDRCDPGAFFPTLLMHAAKPLSTPQPHEVEAFGPVNTVMPYEKVSDAVELAKMGRGSLVGSLFTGDDTVARDVALGVGSHHGRLLIVNEECAKESTGHGSPLPHLVHGGPGRAGGGEELGGMRSVMHYMQRTALQGSPTTLSKVCDEFHRGGELLRDRVHPFRKYFEELEIGETLITHRRTITEADIVNFACLSGDHFYAHVDEIGAKDSIFEKRVAHGYLVIAVAAGMFVDPGPGPVLANYGMDNLRFTQPVYIGDTLQVRLTCKRKTLKDKRDDEPLQGIVHWDVEVTNQDADPVALYTILTLVKSNQDEPQET